MRRSLQIAALAAAFLTPSCSDNPAGPTGPVVDPAYRAEIDFYSSYSGGIWGLGDDVYTLGTSVFRMGANEDPSLVEIPTHFRRPARLWGNESVLYAWDYDRVTRFDGSDWTSISVPGDVYSLHGTDNGEMFGVGYASRVFHYDGAHWTVDSLETNAWLNFITVGGPDDAYIFADGGRLFHYDGERWSSPYETGRYWYSGWKCPDGPLYLTANDTLLTFDGSNFRQETIGDVAAAWVWGRSPTEVYCIGRNGNESRVLAYDGDTWTDAGVVDTWNVDAIWGDRARGQLYVWAGQQVWKVSPSSTTPVFGQPDRNMRFRDLWRSETGAVYAVGELALRYDDNGWIDLGKQELTTHPVSSVWGRSEQEIYAVGSDIILHYNGEAWTWVSGGWGHTLSSVHGNRRDVFAVGWEGLILRNDGHSWERMESGTTYGLNGVYAWDTGAFAVGQSGAILRFDGRDWRPVISPVGWTINDIFGFGPTNIYAVGESSTEICHFDGSKWSPVDIGFTGSGNESIWGTSDRNLFIAQYSGNVLHFDGTTWSSLPHVTSSRARAVCEASSGAILTATESGIVRYSR